MKLITFGTSVDENKAVRVEQTTGGYTVSFAGASIDIGAHLFLTSIQSIGAWSISFASHDTLEAIFKSMLMKLPLMAPLIWLAVFASIRRSQYERLQQEYAHKEALAKSYESYKKQLEALLKDESEPLQKELISKAIEAISYNASQTLDGKHRDKMPLEHALDVLASEKGQSLLDRLRKLLHL